MTDLTDRLRTCAAYILARATNEDPWAIEFVSYDTADLLIEASNVLEKAPEPLGEPMAIIPPVVPKAGWTTTQDVRSVPKATWTTNAGDLPAVPTGPPSKRPARVCPQCDSRATKKVYREGSLLMLACPVCGAGWEYTR